MPEDGWTGTNSLSDPSCRVDCHPIDKIASRIGNAPDSQDRRLTCPGTPLIERRSGPALWMAIDRQRRAPSGQPHERAAHARDRAFANVVAETKARRCEHDDRRAMLEPAELVAL